LPLTQHTLIYRKNHQLPPTVAEFVKTVTAEIAKNADDHALVKKRHPALYSVEETGTALFPIGEQNTRYSIYE